MFDYIADLVAEAAERPGDDDEEAFELRKLALVSRARLVLDIIEGQTVHNLRETLPQTSYSDIGAAQGISKQASRIRHTKLEQILKVHRLDGRRHAMARAVVSAKHRRAAPPLRRTRRSP